MVIINVIYMFVGGISVKMFTAATTYFFNLLFIREKKPRNNTLLIVVCFSKPLDLSLTEFKEKSKYLDEIQGQSKG